MPQMPADQYDEIKPVASILVNDADPDAVEYFAAHSALAMFLERIAWTFSGGTPVQQGGNDGNLFVDRLPKWLYSDEGRRTDFREDVAVIVLRNEPITGFGRRERFSHKVRSVIVVDLYAGRTATAEQEIRRLYQFFLRREVAFSTGTFTVRQLTVATEPSLVGVDDFGWANYSFRCVADGIVPYRH